MKEQHANEQAKLDAIENKIEKARKRIEEVKVQKSIKAQQSIVTKNGGGPPSGEMNNDLMFGEDAGVPHSIGARSDSQKPHIPLIGGR
jgi:hypothetical protein